ncbi:MAG: Trk system potassium transporter TrkA [Actinomycetota bacterium]
MKRVIVVGAGEVGSYVAERLSREGHDVVVVEQHRRRLLELGARLDVLTVLGSGTSPSALSEAGLEKADLVVAVTNVDEVNLVACLIATQAGVERTVCRLQAKELRGAAGAEVRRQIGVDLVLDPDAETAEEILQLLVYRGASDIAEMAAGEVILIGARLQEGAPIVGRTLSDLGMEYAPQWDFLFGTITRGDQTIIPRGDHRLEAHDLLRVVCKRKARGEVLQLLGLERTALSKVMLLGGGRTAELLAERLVQRGVRVVVVDRNPDRCEEFAQRHVGPLVIHGDITDADLLVEEDVGGFDAVVALTGEDDANILACLFAKSQGAKETVAVVHRLSLLPLLEEIGIDAALSPRTASANGVLRFVRGDVTAVATFLEGEAEVLETVVHDGTEADGAIVAELRLPKDVLIGAIVRDGNAEIARGRSQLRSNDHVIVFAMPHVVDEVKRVFG